MQINTQQRTSREPPRSPASARRGGSTGYPVLGSHGDASPRSHPPKSPRSKPYRARGSRGRGGRRRKASQRAAEALALEVGVAPNSETIASSQSEISYFKQAPEELRTASVLSTKSKRPVDTIEFIPSANVAIPHIHSDESASSLPSSGSIPGMTRLLSLSSEMSYCSSVLDSPHKVPYALQKTASAPQMHTIADDLKGLALIDEDERINGKEARDAVSSHQQRGATQSDESYLSGAYYSATSSITACLHPMHEVAGNDGQSSRTASAEYSAGIPISTVAAPQGGYYDAAATVASTPQFSNHGVLPPMNSKQSYESTFLSGDPDVYSCSADSSESQSVLSNSQNHFFGGGDSYGGQYSRGSSQCHSHGDHRTRTFTDPCRSIQQYPVFGAPVPAVVEQRYPVATNRGRTYSDPIGVRRQQQQHSADSAAVPLQTTFDISANEDDNASLFNISPRSFLTGLESVIE